MAFGARGAKRRTLWDPASLPAAAAGRDKGRSQMERIVNSVSLDDFLSVVSFFSFLLVFAGFVVVDANIYVSPEVLYFPKTACWCGSRKKKEEEMTI